VLAGRLAPGFADVLAYFPFDESACLADGRQLAEGPFARRRHTIVQGHLSHCLVDSGTRRLGSRMRRIIGVMTRCRVVRTRSFE